MLAGRIGKTVAAGLAARQGATPTTPSAGGLLGTALGRATPEDFGRVPGVTGTTAGDTTRYYALAEAQQAWKKELQQRQMTLQEQQQRAQEAYQQQQLAQQWAMAEMQRQQQAREMAAQIGTQTAGLQSQMWNQALPYALPSGTQYAPGFGPGGAVAGLAALGRTPYVPTQMTPYPMPTQQQIMEWVRQAMAQYGY